MPFLAPIGFALGVGTAATATAAATGVLAASIVGGLTVAGVGLGIRGAVVGSKAQKAASRRGEEAQRETVARSEKIQKQIAGDKEAGIPSATEKAAAAAKETAKRISKRRTKTILTSPIGAPQPDVAKKTLLGQ